jgi:hypothetical protein
LYGVKSNVPVAARAKKPLVALNGRSLLSEPEDWAAASPTSLDEVPRDLWLNQYS